MPFGMPGRMPHGMTTLNPPVRAKWERKRELTRKRNAKRMSVLLHGLPQETKLLVCEKCGKEYPIKPDSETCRCGSREFYYVSGKTVYSVDFGWNEIERVRRIR